MKVICAEDLFLKVSVLSRYSVQTSIVCTWNALVISLFPFAHQMCCLHEARCASGSASDRGWLLEALELSTVLQTDTPGSLLTWFIRSVVGPVDANIT